MRTDILGKLVVSCATMAALLLAAPAARASFGTKFDAADASISGGDGYSNGDNADGTLAWGESYIQMGYMEMYRATRDKKYLKKLIAHAERVISHRDDKTGRKDYRGVAGPVWSATGKYVTDPTKFYAFAVHDGMITWPMADWALTVLFDSSLWNEITDSGFRFQDRALWLSGEVAKTIDAHAFEWSAAEGVYKFPANAPVSMAGAVLPFNQYAALGRTLISQYRLALNPDYGNKAAALAVHLRSFMTAQTDGSFFWRYTASGRIEDISHATIEVSFAAMASPMGWSFTAADLKRFATTFTKRVYRGPHALAEYVDGSGPVNDGAHVCNVGGWLAVVAQDRDLWEPIADSLQDLAFPDGLTAMMFGYAILHRTRNVLDPVLVNREFGAASAFAGIAAGNLDGTGADELVWVRNFDGQIGVARLTESGGVPSWTDVTGYLAYGSGSAWAGVATGNFDGQPGDEIALVRNLDGKIFVMKLVNGALKEIARYTGFGSASRFVGIAAGNFDGVAGDEIALVRNFDGGIYVMKVSGTTLVDVAATTAYGATSNWAGIAAGNFDGVAGDEIAVVRNSDAKLFVLKRSGTTLTQLAVNAEAGASSSWLGITAGDFDGDGADEILADRAFDGNAYAYKMQSGALKGYGAPEYFPTGQQHGVLGAGRARPSSQSRADVLMVRNNDANVFVFDVVPGSLHF